MSIVKDGADVLMKECRAPRTGQHNKAGAPKVVLTFGAPAALFQINSCHRLGQTLSILCAYNNKGHGNNILFVKKEGKDTLQSILGYFAKYLRILGQVS